MKEEWLMPGAVVPVDPDTTKALVDEIKRLIGVIGGMALQARSAPVQEPVICKHEWFSTGAMEPGECRCIKCGVWNTTTPPAAQRPWIGLSEDEIAVLMMESWGCASIAPRNAPNFARAIEAKLKEKNGLHRQHVTDGSPCWCEPEISYTNPETGASVIVHKEPQ